MIDAVGVAQVLDANINRVAEGLRVIEEYTRFISKNKSQTDLLASWRKQVSHQESVHPASLLMIRDITQDMRAKETPTVRLRLLDLLTANFKRVSEGLRVLEEYTGQASYNRLRYDVYTLEKEILLPLYQRRIRPGIYLISDDPDVLIQGLDWGVSLIQLRGKQSSKETLLKQARFVVKHAKKAGIPFIINDYLDIALLVDADGFHSGQDDLSVVEQRRVLGAHKLIGKTTHSLAQGLKAQRDGADYVSVGPIWETPSKAGRKGIGFAYLEAAKDQLTIPYVAIGGIDLGRLEQLIPYRPPLIGLIRDYGNIPAMMARLDHAVTGSLVGGPQ